MPRPLVESGYGSDARDVALEHFGKSIEDIEAILGRSSPDQSLRDDLALAVWRYACDVFDERAERKAINKRVRQIKKRAQALLAGLNDIKVPDSTPPVPHDDHPPVHPPIDPNRRSYTWAEMPPAFRDAHNRLRQRRGLKPIPPPAIDLYVNPIAASPATSANRPVTSGARAFSGSTSAIADELSILLCAKGIDQTSLERELNKLLSLESLRGGRPPDTEYGVLMGRVSTIFELTTGRQASLATKEGGIYSGEFFRIAELVDAAAASAVGRSRKTNKALGKFLTRVLDYPNPKPSSD